MQARRHSLDITEVGGGKIGLGSQRRTRRSTVGSIVAECIGYNRGISHDHRLGPILVQVGHCLVESGPATAASLDSVEHLVDGWPLRQSLEFGDEALL